MIRESRPHRADHRLEDLLLLRRERPELLALQDPQVAGERRDGGRELVHQVAHEGGARRLARPRRRRAPSRWRAPPPRSAAGGWRGAARRPRFESLGPSSLQLNPGGADYTHPPRGVTSPGAPAAGPNTAREGARGRPASFSAGSSTTQSSRWRSASPTHAPDSAPTRSISATAVERELPDGERGAPGQLALDRPGEARAPRAARSGGAAAGARPPRPRGGPRGPASAPAPRSESHRRSGAPAAGAAQAARPAARRRGAGAAPRPPPRSGATSAGRRGCRPRPPAGEAAPCSSHAKRTSGSGGRRLQPGEGVAQLGRRKRRHGGEDDVQEAGAAHQLEPRARRAARP